MCFTQCSSQRLKALHVRDEFSFLFFLAERFLQSQWRRPGTQSHFSKTFLKLKEKVKVPEFPERHRLLVKLWGEAAPRLSLRAAIGLDDVFDLSPADGTAGIGHLLQLDAAGVAQTHMSAGVDDRVHRVLVADGALIGTRLPAWRERGRLGEADRRTGGRSCSVNRKETLTSERIWGCLSWGLCLQHFRSITF